MISNLPKQKSPHLETYIGEFCQIFQEEIIRLLYSSFRYRRGMARIILNKDVTITKSHRPISLPHIDAKILNKILAN